MRPPLRHAGKGLARALSKLGLCSRQQGAELVRAGRVSVNGAVRRDPEWWVDLARDRITVDGKPVIQAAKVYLMLNKPRGLVTTASDEQGRANVFMCLGDYTGLHLSAVGRLDKASEGLLLFTNDTQWAARITDPGSSVLKKYHVQLKCVADSKLTLRIQQGAVSDGERLSAVAAKLIRTGTKTSWLEIALAEGRNRHIRRLMESLGIEVLRLVRIAIGPVALGSLGKGQVRPLTTDEVRALS